MKQSIEKIPTWAFGYIFNGDMTGLTDEEVRMIDETLKSMTLSRILCKWEQDSVVSLFLYLDSVFKHKHKLIHNQAPV